MKAETTERAVKERPILFTGEMVRAILGGKKTQTRRIVKLPKWSTGEWSDFELDDHDLPMVIASNTGCFSRIGCPYGKPGDHLYVREAIRANGKGTMAVYDMDRMPVMVDGVSLDWRWKTKYLTARFSPKEASRITHELLGVRVERVQAITPDYAIAEGAVEWGTKEQERRVFDEDGHRRSQPLGTDVFDGTSRGVPYLVNVFAELWDSINAGRGYGWDVNPWCWVLTFKRLDS